MPEGTDESLMTEKDLTALIAKVAGETVGPAMQEALEPLSKAQGDFFQGMLEYQKAEKPLDERLGKYPIGRKIRALAMAALDAGRADDDPDRAISAIKKSSGWPATIAEDTIKWLEHVKLSLTAGTAATAGDMIMPQYDPEWIDLLRNNAVVRARARTIPMPRGATSRRKQTAAGTATYQGETDTIATSNQTIGRANLSYKKLTALTVVSNDLIRFSAGESDRFVQEDLLRVCGLREDRAFLTGNPPTDAGSPQGIRFQTIAANIAASAGVTLANVQADLTNSVSLVQASNVPATPQSAGWFLSASTYWVLYALATTTGDWIFVNGLSQAQPLMLGFPVYITTQLEVGNSWIGANSGLIFFCHFPSLEIHDSLQRTVGVHPFGAYHNTDTSAVVSGISNDETVITVIAEHDFLQTYDTATAIKTGYAT